MRNIIRFVIGLGVFFVLFVLIGLLLLLFTPLIIIGSILFYILVAIGIILFLAFGFFTFIWHMSRKEPDIEKESDYSI